MIFIGPPGVGFAGLGIAVGQKPGTGTVACVKAPCPGQTKPTTQTTTKPFKFPSLPKPAVITAPKPLPAPSRPTTQAPSPAPAPSRQTQPSAPWLPSIPTGGCTTPPKTAPPAGTIWSCNKYIASATTQTQTQKVTAPTIACIQAPCPTGAVQIKPTSTDVAVLTADPGQVKVTPPNTATLPNGIPTAAVTTVDPTTVPEWARWAKLGAAGVGVALLGYGAVRLMRR